MTNVVAGNDGGGRRYYLDGRPLYCGARVELLLEDGWLPAAFGMGLHQEAKLHVALGGSWRSADLILCEGAYLRWPQESQDEPSQVAALPLSEQALACLRERRRQQTRDRARRGKAWVDSGLVFTYGKGTKVHPDNLKREMARLCEKAGVRRIAIHTLRDTFATLLAQQVVGEESVSLEVISGYLGHVDPTVTLHRYRQVQQEEMRKIALRKLRQGTASLTGMPEDEGWATD